MTRYSDDRMRQNSREPERLPEPVANKLLERASEIDARLRAGSTVAELREAAKSAGISAEAFEAALAEVAPETKKVPVMVFERAAPPATSFNLRRFLTLLPLSLLPLLVPLVYSGINAKRQQRSIEARQSAPGVSEHVIRVTCLSSEEATEVVKAIMLKRGPVGTRAFRMEIRGNAPNLLRITASDELFQEIRIALNKAENDPSQMCSAKSDGAQPSSDNR